MLIYGSRRQSSQPRGPSRVNWQHPLARGLVSAVYPSAGSVQDAVGVAKWTMGSSQTQGIGPMGTEFRGGGSAFVIADRNIIPQDSSNYAIALLVSGGSGTGMAVSGQFGGNVMGQNGTDFYSWSTFDTFGPATVGKYDLIAQTRVAGGNTEAYFNGRLKTSIGTTGLGTTGNTTLMCRNAAGDVSFLGNMALASFHSRGLIAAEMRMLADNPWQMLRKSRRMLFSAPAGGGSLQDVSASGGATATGSGQLSVSISLAGIGVSVASGSATAKADVSLAGTGIAQASGQAGAGFLISISASGLAQAVGAALASLQANIAAAGGATASGSGTLASGNLYDLAAAGAAVASGSASISASIVLAASGSAVAGGNAQQKVDIQLSAQALAQAAGSGVLKIEVPLAAFGSAIASGVGTLQLVDHDVFVLGAPRRVQISGSEPRRPVQRFSSRPGQYSTRTRH